MNRIHVLDTDISKRLAAGEVVQNPASVVKELVENSIDSGATSVSIEIKGGGIDKIRVTDNGCGILPEDMKFVLVKHATSKIRYFDDIYSINTLGFRGEALASISAVSNIEIKSQAVNSEEGRVLKNYGINSGNPEPVGLPFGTSIIVSDLFFNIPARKKFLKSSAHEGYAVTDLIAKMILSRPDISFKYINGDKIIYHSPGNGHILNAIASVYGPDIVSHLNEVCLSENNIQIKGYVSDFQLVYRTMKNISFFVNNRFVISKSLSEAVINGYNERLMKGKFPFSVIYLDIPLSDVDVNVHPSKSFVAIDNLSEVFQLISNSIKNAINFYSIPEGFNSSNQKTNEYLSNSLTELDNIKPSDPDRLSFTDIIGLNNDVDYSLQPETSVFKDILNYQIIGSIFNTYLIVETINEVFFIDQHAAHERINYENIISNQKSMARNLLLPVIINISDDDLILFEANKVLLNEIGFIFENFGGNSIKISAVPSVLSNESIIHFVDDILIELKKHNENIILKKDKLIKHACRISVKAGDKLSSEEINILVKELVESNVIPSCPHGRPVAIKMTKDDFEKSFKRKV